MSKDGPMKSNVTMIAVALVVVVALAGAAVFLFNNGGSGGGDDIEKGSLPVFGNANGDEVVDSKDIELLNKMIAE